MIKKTTSHLPALAWAVSGALALSQNPAQTQVFVAHISDFHRHIELHRERVFQLGMTLGREKFPELNGEKLEQFLRLHDASKTMTSALSLEKYNYQNQISPLARLFSFYGKAHESEESKILLRGTVNDINAIDQHVAHDFFANHPDISHESAQKFYLIEKIADLVDRSLDPVAIRRVPSKTDTRESIYSGHRRCWFIIVARRTLRFNHS